MITAQIVDDHPVSRWGLQQILSGAPDIQLTGMFASAEEVLGAQPPPPDVVLLDLYLAEDLPCVSLISELAVRSKVLVISASKRSNCIAACVRAGASGFLHKSNDPAAVIAGVRDCAMGRSSFPDVPAADGLEAGLLSLSPRERQVLAYIAGGYTHDQAARRLDVSRHTVETHLKRLRSKIGGGNKAHLTRVALHAGIGLEQPRGTS